MANMVAGAVLLLNKILDLWILIIHPDQLLYLSKQVLIITASLEVAGEKITRSSTKRWKQFQNILVILSIIKHTTVSKGEYEHRRMFDQGTCNLVGIQRPRLDKS
jgi:hypothetical protein